MNVAPWPALAAAIAGDSNGLQQDSLRKGTGNFSEQNKETGIAEQGTVAANGGQGADLLEKRWWDDQPDGVSFVSYSASSSLRTKLKFGETETARPSAARISAPNINLRMGFSPNQPAAAPAVAGDPSRDHALDHIA